jgi:hypothetical protein
MVCSATIASAIRLSEEAGSLLRNIFSRGFPATLSILLYVLYNAVRNAKASIKKISKEFVPPNKCFINCPAAVSATDLIIHIIV